ncbi:hypothetical protein [Hyphomicrobium sp. CS1GBMeth3]|uniref:hypothetical protein n=1 Tax=Hyphomicrobium sp. CS1GBMeth3 TaxID=1892845 RepID=UPI000931FA88|nr:hypothetical protein [Hyphomicrobium sp. CS1GBMeth3]
MVRLPKNGGAYIRRRRTSHSHLPNDGESWAYTALLVVAAIVIMVFLLKGPHLMVGSGLPPSAPGVGDSVR